MELKNTLLFPLQKNVQVIDLSSLKGLSIGSLIKWAGNMAATEPFHMSRVRFGVWPGGATSRSTRQLRSRKRYVSEGKE